MEELEQPPSGGCRIQSGNEMPFGIREEKVTAEESEHSPEDENRVVHRRCGSAVRVEESKQKTDGQVAGTWAGARS